MCKSMNDYLISGHQLISLHLPHDCLRWLAAFSVLLKGVAPLCINTSDVDPQWSSRMLDEDRDTCVYSVH